MLFQKFNFYLFGAIFISLIYSGYIAFHSYTVDSEIWSISSSAYFLKGGHFIDSLYSKPLFYGLLSVLYQFDLSSVQHLAIVKALFILNSVVIIALLGLVFHLLFKNSTATALALAMLVSNPSWLADGFRVRADFLALTFSLLSLLVFLNFQNSKKIVFPLLALVFLSLLSTPKSLIWNLPLLILYFHQFFRTNGTAARIKMLAILVGGVLIILSYYQMNLQFRFGFRSALSYFLSSSLHWNNFSKLSFLIDLTMIANSVLASPWYWAFILVSMLFSAVLFVKKMNRHQISSIFAFVLFLFLFLSFKPKAAFLWASVGVIWVLASGPMIQFVSSRSKWIAIPMTIILIVHSLYWTKKISILHSGEEQIVFLKDLESFANRHELKIFDSMGFHLRGKNVYTYVGKDDPRGNSFALQNIKTESPDLILKTDRIVSYIDEIDEILDEGYQEIAPSLYLKRSLNYPNEFKQNVAYGSIFNQRVLLYR